MVRPLPSPVPDPRRQQYERQVDSLRHVCDAVAELELEMQEFEQNLLAFERYYLGRVQPDYALLDRLRVELIEEKLLQDSADAELLRELELQQRKARDSRTATCADEPQARWTPRAAPREAKALYRKAARMVHPDLASSPEEAKARHRYMSELNAAFADGDLDRMQDMYDLWAADAVDHYAGIESGIEQRLERMRGLIERAWERHAKRTKDLETLRASEMAVLMGIVQEAEARGRDLVADVIARIRTETEAVRAELAELRGEGAP